MPNIVLTIAYDGGAYLGFQKTKMGPSIEEVLSNTPSQILQHPVHLQAASRTDAGVHAKGQVAHFLTDKQFPLDKCQASLNRMLPADIKIVAIKTADENFHSTKDATGKEYRYEICTGPYQLPKFRHYSWHLPERLDALEMKQAASSLIGEHDFRAFCNSKKNEPYEDYIRRIDRIEIEHLDQDRFAFTIAGNHFLYKMVRNIVGTLADVGRGKLTARQVAEILQSQDRTSAGVTAPAHGLSLEAVYYN